MIHTSVGTISKATAEDYDGVLDLENQEGDGVLAIGKVTKLNNHTITDSEKNKFRFVCLHIDVIACRRRNFVDGKEINPKGLLESKQMKGHLNIFGKKEADPLVIPEDELKTVLADAFKEEEFQVLGEINMVKGEGIVVGNEVRFKTKGHTRFLETVVRVSKDMKGRSNYSGEKMDMGQVFSMAKSSDKHVPTNEDDVQEIDRDEDEWDVSDED